MAKRRLTGRNRPVRLVVYASSPQTMNERFKSGGDFLQRLSAYYWALTIGSTAGIFGTVYAAFRSAPTIALIAIALSAFLLSAVILRVCLNRLSRSRSRPQAHYRHG